MNETKWLTVKEASLLCAEMGLNRTSKTIRSWARRGHVEATKQTTRNGEMWVLDKDELVTKIKAELEFKEQQGQVQTSANHDPNISEPVQTRADQFEPVRTGANPSERQAMNRGEPQADMASDSQILELEAQVRSLEIDKGVRDQHIKFLTEQNKTEHDLALRQNKYIGHLETKVYALGDKPDLKFLDAPKPSEPEIANNFAQDHPDQQNLYTG